LEKRDKYALLITKDVIIPSLFYNDKEPVYRYNGSLLQQTLLSILDWSDFSVVKSRAVIPELGDPLSKSVVSNPTSVMASSVSSPVDALFPLSYAEVNSRKSVWSRYPTKSRWWTRTSDNPTSSQPDQHPHWYMYGTTLMWMDLEVTKKQVFCVRPAVWVKFK
jgi:hypothetical protein